MNRISLFFRKVSIQVINSIAFYPSLISLAFLLFSFLVMNIEYKPFIIDIKRGLTPMLVQGVDNARLILGTISGSIFSLMVFSFSMVMLVLNRASATLSPRVIPGLITKKAHQVVLGVYLGTIIYSLILIINIQSPDAEFQIPTLGILLSMVFAISCLGLFVYFIHSISQSIQVDNVMQSIFWNTFNKIQDQEVVEKPAVMPNTDSWWKLSAANSGYLKQVNIKRLRKICIANDITVQITENLGFFFVKGYHIAKVSKEICTELEDEIRECFIYYIEEHVSDHYSFGFKQISEISVKALSPGINDPATAIKGIDMLTILFTEKLLIREKAYVTDKEGKLLIFYRCPTLEELMFINLMPIREYGKTDATVMLKLLDCMKYLAYADRNNQDFQALLHKYTQNIIDSSVEYINNEIDMEQINNLIRRINSLLNENYLVDITQDTDN